MGFAYPPAPSLLLIPWPNQIVAAILAVLIGFATVWLLWREFSKVKFPRPVQFLLLVAVMATPATLYLATQSFVDVLALFLSLMAWRYYLGFTKESRTQSVFLAGMIIAAAFFLNFYALVVAVAFALIAPFLVPEGRGWAGIAAAFVLIFPVLVFVGAFMYVCWIFVGDPLAFIKDSNSSLFAYSRLDPSGLAIGWPLSIQNTWQDLIRAPIIFFVALLLLKVAPARVIVLFLPAILIIIFRTFGLVFPSYLAIGIFLVIALAAIPQKTPSKYWPVFVVAAVVQLDVAFTFSYQGELGVLYQALISARSNAADVEEVEVGKYLRDLPRQSVLADDRVAYRVIARAGTAAPVLLPADTKYQFAESNPAGFVKYLLVPSDVFVMFGGRLNKSYAFDPPTGFTLQKLWSQWKIYEFNEQATVSLSP